jgi:hypothetical protein
MKHLIHPLLQEPTMMSKEARQLMLSGLGAQGLELWKVGGQKSHWQTAVNL